METGRWRNFLPAEERLGYEQAGFGVPDELGRRPALLVIDCTLAFTGRSPDQTLEEATREFPTACGPAAWDALPHIVRLIEAFRMHRLPIVYTRSELSVRTVMGGAVKGGRQRGAAATLPPGNNDLPPMLDPREGELVLDKTRASIFFDSYLATYLRTVGADSVVATGATTSGCVRASVVDAMSHGFTTFVAEDACIDRAPTAHDANLWDMHAKYASVVTSADVIQRLAD